ncbi:MAG: Fic family protein [Actinomycetota bacterium]|nr:Fic family protein [Actinomycetota bacterium]
MDVAAFRDSPVGQLAPVRGHDAYLGRDYEHFAFVPHPLPSEVPLDGLTIKLMTEADRAVGRLDAAATRLPNPALLVRPSLYREAVSTSALEGTYAPFHEVLAADYLEERKRSAEVREILNYVRAAERGLELIKERPICLNLIAPLQAIIVEGTRGDGYDAGQLRTGQVYIGERKLGIERSRFVPPPAGDVLVQGVSDWEKWINANDHTPLLVKAALGHYQFETLHPFSDGNGRLGRLIVTLQLVDAGAMRYPVLNLSPWFEPRKDAYKDALLAVSRTGDYAPWLCFFFEAVMAQAEDAVRRIEALMTARAEFLEVLREDRARGVVLEIVEDLIGYPVITPTEAAALHNVTYPPAARAVSRLERLGILKEITGSNYGRIYVCERVMRIVEQPGT